MFERAPHVRLLTGTAWVTLIFFAMTSALLSVCLKRIGQEFEISYKLKGALAPARALALASSGFFCAYLADRIGKKGLMVGASVIIASCMLWVANCGSYAELVAGVLVMGIGLGCVEALVSPLIAELHPDSVATHLNLLHAFYPLGLAVSAMGVGLALRMGARWQTPFAFSALPVLAIGSVYLVSRFPQSHRTRRGRPLAVRTILRTPMFWVLAVSMILVAGSEGSLLYWGPHFVQSEYGASAVAGGAMLTVFGLTMAGGRFVMSGVVRRFSLGRVMVITALVGAGGTLALVLVDGERFSFVMMALSGVFCAVFWPGVLAMATDRIATGSSVLLAMLTMSGSLGFGIHPSLVGALADARGEDLRAGMLLIPLGFALAGLVLLPVAWQERPQPAAGADIEA